MGSSATRLPLSFDVGLALEAHGVIPDLELSEVPDRVQGVPALMTPQ